MNLRVIRQAIAEQAKTMRGLNVAPYMLNAHPTPALVVGDAKVEYHQTMVRASLTKVTFTCWLLVSRGADVQSQQNLDDFLSPDDGGLLAALEDAPDGVVLGGVAQSLFVRDAQTVMPTIGDTTYYGARLTVEVLG